MDLRERRGLNRKKFNNNFYCLFVYVYNIFTYYSNNKYNTFRFNRFNLYSYKTLAKYSNDVLWYYFAGYIVRKMLGHYYIDLIGDQINHTYAESLNFTSFIN